MNKHPIAENRYYFNKFFECFFSAVVLTIAAFMAAPALMLNLGVQRSDKAMMYLIVAVWSIGLVTSLLYSLYWQKREKKENFDSEKVHHFLRAIIRISLAYLVSVYGFAKIFQAQFAPSYFRNDIPVGNLNGLQLTWNYFGHSYSMAVIIAGLQIGGATLLLFRRTTLSGTILLLPVMLNIILINQFYDISGGAYFISVVITAGLCYLLLLRWADLKSFLFSKTNSSTLIRPGFIKIVLKFIAIGLACLTVQSYLKLYPTTSLEGKWRVDTLISDHHLITDAAWMTNSHAWKNIYIERGGKIIFCANPYIYEESSSVGGQYIFDKTNKRLKLILEADTSSVTIEKISSNLMEWNTILLGDTIKLKLYKVTD